MNDIEEINFKVTENSMILFEEDKLKSLTPSYIGSHDWFLITDKMKLLSI